MEILSEKEIIRKLRRVWRGMHERCEYPKHKSYHRYGGRGISVCQEWEEFKPFYAWAIKHGYKPGLTIEREKNDEGYSPSNCCFVTRKVQAQNTPLVKNLTLDGQTKSQTAWSEDDRSKVRGISIGRRLKRGLEIRQAIENPPATILLKTAFGETKPFREWLKDTRCVVNESCLRDRILRKWSFERALTQPSGNYTKGGREFEAFGESKTFTKWAKDPRCKVKKSTLMRRLFIYGWEPEKAITEIAGERKTE